MKTFTIQDKQYSICEKWDEISLKQYIDIDELSKDEQQLKEHDEYLNDLTEKYIGQDVKFKGTDITYSGYMIRLLKCLSNCDEQTFNLMTTDEFVKLIPIFTSFLTDKPDFKYIKNFELNCTKYKLEPFTELCAGAIICIQDYMMLNDNKPDIGKLCAIIYRPFKMVYNEEQRCEIQVIDDFNLENIEYRTNLFLQSPAKYFIGAASFFLCGNKTLIQNIQQCLSKKLGEKMGNRERAQLTNLIQSLTQYQ